MLAEAVRNTQPTQPNAVREPKRSPKAKKVAAAAAACVD